MAAMHPLQRLRSPSRSISAALHAAALLSFAASFKYLVDYPSIVNSSRGWHFQYLTIIGLAMATLTFAFALLADFTLFPQLFRIKNFLSMATAPLEVLISILYWGIRSIDKKLVVPEWSQMSLVADIGFHAIPAIVLTTDLVFFSPPWGISVLPSLSFTGALAFSYWIWIEYCYKHNGWYPYPIFTLLNNGQRVVLFAVSALLMTLSTLMLKWLYGRINGTYPGSRSKVAAKRA